MINGLPAEYRSRPEYRSRAVVLETALRLLRRLAKRAIYPPLVTQSHLRRETGTMALVYHFTTSAHLPRILKSGELHATKVTPELEAYEASLHPFGSIRVRMPKVMLVDATKSPDRERVATGEYGSEYGRPDFYADGDMAIVRFTLEEADFEPWKQVCEANGYSAAWIKLLETEAHERGSDPRLWMSRAEPLPLSRVVAIHTQDIFNGRDQWLPFDKDAFNNYGIEGHPDILGIDIGKVCFWSKQTLNEHRRTAFAPLKVTAPRVTDFNVETGDMLTDPNVDGLTAYSRLMQFPDVRKSKASVRDPGVSFDQLTADPNNKDGYLLWNKNADPIAKVVSSFTPQPKPLPLPASKNAQRLTTAIRFTITADTFRRYPVADIDEEKPELIEAGMWMLPYGDEPYTIRMNAFDIGEFLSRFGSQNKDYIAVWAELKRNAASDGEWYDFDFKGEELTRVTYVRSDKAPGDVNKRWHIDNPSTGFNPEYYDLGSAQAWWDKGNRLCQRAEPVKGINAKDFAFIAEGMLDILVLAMMDRSVVQERTPRASRSSAFEPGGWLYSPELDVQEVTIRCPGFYRASNGEHGEPTGRKVKMHRRRGHVRTLHRGTDKEFKIRIDPVWINAVAGVEPPPVVYTVE